MHCHMHACMGSQIYDLLSVSIPDESIMQSIAGRAENPIQIGHAIDQPARSAMQSNSQPDQGILAMRPALLQRLSADPDQLIACSRPAASQPASHALICAW